MRRATLVYPLLLLPLLAYRGLRQGSRWLVLLPVVFIFVIVSLVLATATFVPTNSV